MLASWRAKHNAALAKDYAGLRLAGSVSRLDKPLWSALTEYELIVHTAIDQYRMLALCTYALDRCDTAEAIEVAHRHQFALIKRDGCWLLLENPECKRMEKVHQLAAIVENSDDATYSAALDGTVVTWSPGTEITYGYSA